MRISKAISTLTTLVPQGEPILFTGPPGVGKTSLVKIVADKLKMDLIINHPVLDDRVDYKGLPGIVNEEAHFMPFGNLKKLIKAKKPTLVFFDDLGQSPADVQAAIMQLILGRELNGNKISDKVVFVAATNRKQDKAGVSGLLAPLLDRFIAVLPIDFHLDDWAAWMMEKRYDPMLVAFARLKPNLMIEAKASGLMEKVPTPRAIAGVGELLKNNVDDFEILQGAAGAVWATEFNAYRKEVIHLPKLDTIWKTPKKAKIPEKPSVLFALMAFLAYHVEEKHIDAMMTYLRRVSPSYAVCALKDCVGRVEGFENNTQFFEWVSENEAVFSFNK